MVVRPRISVGEARGLAVAASGLFRLMAVVGFGLPPPPREMDAVVEGWMLRVLLELGPSACRSPPPVLGRYAPVAARACVAVFEELLPGVAWR